MVRERRVWRGREGKENEGIVRGIEVSLDGDEERHVHEERQRRGEVVMCSKPGCY